MDYNCPLNGRKNTGIFVEMVNTNEKYAKELKESGGIIKEDDWKYGSIQSIQKGDCPYVGSE